VWPETDRVKTLALDVEGWPGIERPACGRRLTADDGYKRSGATRSRLRTAGPGSRELTVERIDDGEVRPYLTGDDTRETGSSCRSRRCYFVWDQIPAGPCSLSAAAPASFPSWPWCVSGTANHDEVRRSCSIRKVVGDVIYRNELERYGKRADGLEIVFTLTREQPPGWTGFGRRSTASSSRRSLPTISL